MTQPKLTVQATINAPLPKTWSYWNSPQHIVNWNYASDDWETTAAEVNLKVGAEFSSHMRAKDNSFAFDFKGTYTEIITEQKIAYKMEDGRTVEVIFEKINDNETSITECFDPENDNLHELQTNGWQAILNNFKRYTERN